MKYALPELPELSYVTDDGNLIQRHSSEYPHEMLYTQYFEAWKHAHDTVDKYRVIELREDDYHNKKSFKKAKKERQKVLEHLELAEEYLFSHLRHFEIKDNE